MKWSERMDRFARWNSISVFIMLAIVFAFIFLRDFVRTHRKPNELLKQTLVQNPEHWNEVKPQTEDWNVKGVSIRDRVFHGLDFEDTDFDGAVLENVVMKDCNLSRASMYRTRFKNVRIEGGNLSEMSVSHANWEDVVIADVEMGGVRIQYSEWNRVNLKRVNLANGHYNPSFNSVVMKDVLIEDSDLGPAHFGYVDARGVTIKGTNLSRVLRRDAPGEQEQRYNILNSQCGPAFREDCEKKKDSK